MCSSTIMLRITTILVTFIMMIIDGGSAFCANCNPLLSIASRAAGYKQRQQSHPRLFMGGKDDEILQQILRKLGNMEKTLHRLDLRTGNLVEEMVTSKIKSKKYEVRKAEHIVDLISPEASAILEKQKEEERIIDYLYKNCTKQLLGKIVEKEIPHDKMIDKWTPEQKNSIESDSSRIIADGLKMKDYTFWSWERAAYQLLDKKKNHLSQSSPEFTIIQQFMDLIMEGSPNNKWIKGSPVFNEEEEETKGFDHKKAMVFLRKNKNGLVPSLIFADKALEHWSYKRDSTWAIPVVDIDGIRVDYVTDYSIIISIIEVKSSTAGRTKANDQLLFRAHLVDEYANIAWNGKKDTKTLSLNLQTHIFDYDSNGLLQEIPDEELKKDDFKIAYPVRKSTFYGVE